MNIFAIGIPINTISNSLCNSEVCAGQFGIGSWFALRIWLVSNYCLLPPKKNRLELHMKKIICSQNNAIATGSSCDKKSRHAGQKARKHIPTLIHKQKIHIFKHSHRFLWKSTFWHAQSDFSGARVRLTWRNRNNKKTTTKKSNNQKTRRYSNGNAAQIRSGKLFCRRETRIEHHMSEKCCRKHVCW